MTQWVNTSIASLKNIALLIRKQTDEKKEVTFFVRKESMSRPKTPQGNHWKCQRKSAIKREQPLFAEFWRLCIYLVVNMSRLQSPTRSHFQSWKRHLTDRGFEASHTRASKWCIKIWMNMEMLSSIMGKHSWSDKKTGDRREGNRYKKPWCLRFSLGPYVVAIRRIRIRGTVSVGGIVGRRRYRNGAAHEPFLRAPCSWQKCRWISSWSNEVDRT